MTGRVTGDTSRVSPAATPVEYTSHGRLPQKEMYELGPGQQIKAMVKRIDNDAWKAFKNVAA